LQLTEIKQHFERALNDAYNASPRSNIAVTFEISMGSEVHYTVAPAPVDVAQAYEDWHEGLAEGLFGVEPDARLRLLVEQAPLPLAARVLDLGAGTGRNALYLASLGHPVDAIDLVPKFVQGLAAEAGARGLPLRAIQSDVLRCRDNLAPSYTLIIASGLIGDFRSRADLRALFELASARLELQGKMLLNVHLAVSGYVPEPAVRQWAEQCCATCFTRGEFEEALRGLPLRVTHECRAFDFEREHLPAADWPPTAAFPEWAQCQHMFALPAEQTPIELWWIELTHD
jgi:SAM-dependent methyltransferase